MKNNLNSIMLGIINQHQIWVKHRGENEPGESGSSGQEFQTDQIKVKSLSTGVMYGMGLVGACIFYLKQGTTFRQKGLGILKALLWPLFLVNELLEFLNKR